MDWLAQWLCLSFNGYRFVSLVVKASTTRMADPGFDSGFVGGDFSGLSHTSDLKISNPGAWCYRASAGTGWPGVSIL